jgi:hypothetical protein
MQLAFALLLLLAGVCSDKKEALSSFDFFLSLCSPVSCLFVPPCLKTLAHSLTTGASALRLSETSLPLEPGRLHLAPSNRGLFFSSGHDTGFTATLCGAPGATNTCVHIKPCSRPHSCTQVSALSLYIYIYIVHAGLR